MLYNLLLAVIILSFLTPIISVWCFIMGYNLKAKKDGETPIQTPKIHLPKRKTDEQKRAEQERQELIDLYNEVNAYNGTTIERKEV